LAATGVALAVLAAGYLGTGVANPALAEDGSSNGLVTTVTGGSRTASINSGDDLAFSSTESTYSGSDTGYAYGTLVVQDESGTGAGWIVTAISSDMTYLGSNPGGQSIPAANVDVARGNPPEMNDGMDIDVTGGPNALTNVPHPLDEEQILLEAESGYGMGRYSLELEFGLTPPPYTRAGNYQGTLTITIVPNLPPT
jgi:hypothetical protein